MELKNIAWELHEIYTSFNSQTDQVEESLSEIEDQLNKIKQNDKIRGKVKGNEQNLQKIRDYMKRQNLHLISIPEREG